MSSFDILSTLFKMSDTAAFAVLRFALRAIEAYTQRSMLALFVV
jgi:hypothetical protein